MVHEFKPGAFNAAHRSDAEIIPIGVAYGHPDAYFHKESFLTHMKRIGSRRRLTVAVEIGGPLQPSAEPSLEMNEHARRVVSELADRARARLGGEAPSTSHPATPI